jgi:hypothetical protein
MANTKISALPASTTPLAGTEVLPIVQSSTTRQVSVANLTAGRAISATQLTLTTGNLIVASGQGIDFSATPGTGTSELLSDYEEGTWTPVYDSVGASFTYDEQYGWYVRVGALVTIQCRIKAATATGTTSNGCRVSGLPFSTGSLSALSSTPGAIGLSTFPTTLAATSNNASSIITLWQAGTTNQPTAADAVGAFFTLSMTYRAA